MKCTIFSVGGNSVTENNKKRITVDIQNTSYTIVGTESASHVRLVASLVDQKMKEIKEMNQHLDTKMLAVLTAVNTMNDYLKLKEDYASLLGTLKEKED
ncbi:cell division protein ZapA [Virgibacillus halotolerans]|uniref:cell division protein ZapA n=1 Tax=Virgibacillus halotolerans TaxID=1071053 RepID=UPI001EF79EB9|nr:cell division protein ZapA [Virgibacillus halotolerans]